MRPYLLVGGAGFIGTALTRALGPGNVHVFDNFSPVVHRTGTIRAAMLRGPEVTVGDVCSPDDWAALLAQGTPQTIYYLAAETGTGRSLQNCALNARVNVLGLGQMLDALSRAGAMPERIVLTSTRAVYGEGPYLEELSGTLTYPDQRDAETLASGAFEFAGLSPVPMRAAAHSPRPVNVYGATKVAQEHLLDCWARAHGVPHLTFRLQNVFGAGQSVSNPYTGVLIHFIRSALAARPIAIFENGGITRDFVHVDDVARLLARAAGGGRAGAVYDCGSGVRVELESVARMVGALAGSGDVRRTSEFRIGDVRHACADIADTTADFDWRPQIDLRDGLTDLIAFFRDEEAA